MDDYLLFIILIVGALFGAGLTAIGVLYFSAQASEKEKKQLEQALSAKLTHEFNQEKKEITQKQKAENNQQKFGRQRLSKKIDEQFEELRKRDRTIENLNYQIKDAEYALDEVKNLLKVAQDDHTALQNAHQQLAADYRTQQVRLEAAETRADECQKQIDLLNQQLKQMAKAQDALIFATNMLRETRKSNRELQKRLAYKEDAPKGEVGLGFQDIDDMEPVHAVRLFEAGIHTPAMMREYSHYEIAKITGVAPQRALAWISKSSQSA